jgi:type IV pilus assembly protein PilC
MPNYFYIAKSLDGKTVEGERIAGNPSELSKLLRNKGLFLVDAITDEKKKAKKHKQIITFGVSSSEKIMMVKNLSVMIGTGLSLVKSFEILASQSRNKKLKDSLLSIKEQINKGEPLSSAIAKHPDIFSEFFLSMIKVGEESGTLEEVLRTLALQLEKEHKLKSEVQGAMVYPVIVLTLMLFVGIIIVVVVLPRLNDFFQGLNAEIPFYTKMIIDFGKFSQERWYVLIIVPLIFGLFLWRFLKTKIGKWSADTVLLRIPVISSLVKEENCAILVRSLSSLLGAGVSLIKALEVTSGTVGNFYFRKAITDSVEKIKKGEKLSETLTPYKNIFPFGAIEMMEVGEETGKTATVLKTLADFYEEEVITATAKLSSIIEPVLIIILGLAVGFFAFSIIGPIYSSLDFIK